MRSWAHGTDSSRATLAIFVLQPSPGNHRCSARDRCSRRPCAHRLSAGAARPGTTELWGQRRGARWERCAIDQGKSTSSAVARRGIPGLATNGELRIEFRCGEASMRSKIGPAGAEIRGISDNIVRIPQHSLSMRFDSRGGLSQWLRTSPGDRIDPTI